MVARIEIVSQVSDARAMMMQRSLESSGWGGKISSLELVDVYTVDRKLSKVELDKIAAALANPVTQRAIISTDKNPEGYWPSQHFKYCLEKGFLPGVTDNVGTTAQELIEDLLKVKFADGEGVYFSQMLFLEGDLTKQDVQVIGSSLINPLIQRLHVKSAQQYRRDKGMDLVVPKVDLKKAINVSEVNLEVEDKELVAIGKKGVKNADGSRRGPLALDLSYMKAIQSYFRQVGRAPTDVELETIAQTWSEHCKHTIFADPIDEVKGGLFKTYIKVATEKIRRLKGAKDICVSVFSDNAGGVIFDDKYIVSHKVETHNSPSALDPFGGAITGIVGVNRDAIGFGMGAKPIINSYGFCLADPSDDKPLYKAANFEQRMLSPRRIMDGVIAGVNVGGNCSGIPTPQGFIYFDDRYKGKPLVFAGTVGLLPRKIKQKAAHLKKAKPGDYIVMVGGRVGIDGIHGATFSSESLNTGSPATAVQIGDPITQKKLSDALVKEARDEGLYNSITDDGAGGLSSSVGEMAKEAGGCVVNLEKVPLKYPGLDPWQIWISESQERMTLAVPKLKWRKFSKLMASRGVEATVIGQFTKSKRCVVKYGDRVVMDIEMNFLHNGLPKRILKSDYEPVIHPEPQIPEVKNQSNLMLAMLGHLNLASFEFISRQYDHEVQGTSVLKPLQGKGAINGEVSVVRPLLFSQKGVAITQSTYPRFGDIDTYWMAAAAIDSAIRNLVVVGVDPDKIVLLDNFCWCSSTEPGRLGQLKRALQACYDLALAYRIPFISGKDSMFNDFQGFDAAGQPIKISIPPTLLVSGLGLVDDINQVISMDLKMVGDLLYVIGQTKDELGGSEYYHLLARKLAKQLIGNKVPQFEARANRQLYQVYHRAVKKGLVASGISVGLGGLGVALSKSALAGGLGVEVDLDKLNGKMREDVALYSQSQGRMVVSVAPGQKKAFEKLFAGLPVSQVGRVNGDRIVVKNRRGVVVDVSLEKAMKTSKSTFGQF